MKMQMRKTIGFVIMLLVAYAGWGQPSWTVEQCMRYAVKHNHEVTQQRLTVEDYRSDKTQAVGAFLPSLHASVGNQYNFGRAIDPETNTYTNVSTFYNGYSVSASIPLFDGFQRVSEWRLAKANLLMGRHGLRAKQDEVALAVFQAYIDLLYYRGTVEMARQKREESAQLLRQTRTMAEVGTKSEADVAQMEATQAADDYEVTRQEGLLAQALLVLKRQMNYPAEETLIVEPMADDEAEPIEEPTDNDAAAIVEVAQVINPKLLGRRNTTCRRLSRAFGWPRADSIRRSPWGRVSLPLIIRRSATRTPSLSAISFATTWASISPLRSRFRCSIG